MNLAPLIRMANQIARSFQVLGEERAVASTASHIKHYWSPPMRAGLEQLRLQPDSPLSPIARKAAEVLSPAKAASGG